MKVATKFVSALTAAQQNQLEQLAAEDPVRRVRMRAHSLLLSAEGLEYRRNCAGLSGPPQ